jgi:DNA-binding response OmpR family regulator
MSSKYQSSSPGSVDDLNGLDVLLVEDSQAVGDALKKLLQLLGANVSGPAATVSEGQSLLAQHLPDVALVDAHLRGGEYSTKLIAQLNEQNVPVIVLTGSPELPPVHVAGTTVLEKPVSEAVLLVYLRPLIVKKRGRKGAR